MIVSSTILTNEGFVPFDLTRSIQPIATVTDTKTDPPIKTVTETFDKLLLDTHTLNTSNLVFDPYVSKMLSVSLIIDIVILDVDKNKRVIPYKAFCFIMKL